MSEAPELKPCPFCGGEANHYHRCDASGWQHTDWIGCTGDCGASTAMHETKYIAVTAWNTRADRIEELEAENKLLNEQLESIEEHGTESLNALPDCLMKLAPALVQVEDQSRRIGHAMYRLHKLKYWLDMDQELFDAMTDQQKADHKYVQTAVDGLIWALKGDNQ